MATIKELLQSFCRRINQPTPTTFAGVTSPTEAQYLEILRYIGDRLRNLPFDWPQLKKYYTFTTTTNQTDYQLPGDFYRMLPATQWDSTNKFPMAAANDAQYAARKFMAFNIYTQQAYHIVGPTGYLYSTAPYSQRSAGTFQIQPGGQNDTDVLALGYLSCNWLQPIDWVASTVYVAGNIRSVNGYVYYCKTGGTSGTTRPTLGTLNTDITDNTVTWRVYTEPYPCSIANTLLTDNDFILFDDDVVIDGLVWRYKQLKGQDYLELKNDWEAQLSMMNGRFKGITITDVYSNTMFDEWPCNVPFGNWNPIPG
jgi:hypothetical protein